MLFESDDEHATLFPLLEQGGDVAVAYNVGEGDIATRFSNPLYEEIGKPVMDAGATANGTEPIYSNSMGEQAPPLQLKDEIV